MVSSAAMTAREPPTTAERLIWFVFAALAWRLSVFGESRGIVGDSLVGACTTIFLAGLGLAAVVVALGDRAGRWLRSPRLVLSFFATLVVAYVVIDHVDRARFLYRYTTDAEVFTSYGARLLLHGKNPYDASLYAAMVANRVPVELQTPLADGGFSDRLAYPSLSVVLLVPFVALGIPTTLFYGLCLCVCLGLIFHRAPAPLKPLVLVPFFADPTYLAYAFGGLTDATWALLLCLAVVTWQRPKLAALFVGLACSYKQHAWLLVPFLLVRISTEGTPTVDTTARPDHSSLRDRLKPVVVFGAIVGATLLVTQLPFYLWKPSAWVNGVLEPLRANMVPLGQGLSALVPQAGLPIPKLAFTIAFWGIFAALLVVTGTWSAGRLLAWIGPSLAFFFGHRSFTSYWIFNVLPLVLELCRTELPAGSFRWPFRVRGRVVAAIAGAGGVLLVAVLVHRSIRDNERVEVTIASPIRTWTNNALRIDLHLHNGTNHDIVPRFWVQGTSFQPLPWRVDSGPAYLAPGHGADYSIAAIHNVSEFDVMRGGSLTITDVHSSVRKKLAIAADPASFSPGAVPNAGLRFWDVANGVPTFWKLRTEGSPGARALPALDQPKPALRLYLDPDPREADKLAFTFCPALPACYITTGATGRFTNADLDAREHRVAVQSEFLARPEPLTIWGFPPASANRGPDYEERYGLMLKFGRQQVFMQLGGEAASGQLDDGTYFEVVPGPREQWSRYTIDVAALQKRYAANAYPLPRVTLRRFPILDIPVTLVTAGFTYWSRQGDARSALFGAIEDGRARDTPEKVLAEIADHPGQVDMWRAAYEGDLRNVPRARDHLERAQSLEQHPYIDLRTAYLAFDTDQLAAAKESFARAAPVDPIGVNISLGWIAVIQRDPAEARRHFVAAQVALDDAARKHAIRGEDEIAQVYVIFGLATVEASLGRCAEAEHILSGLPPRERELHEGDFQELVKCRQKK